MSEEEILLEPEVFADIITPTSIQVIQFLKKQEADSIRNVADETELSLGTVYRILNELEEHGILKFETETSSMNTTRKKPILNYQVIRCKPVQ